MRKLRAIVEITAPDTVSEKDLASVLHDNLPKGMHGSRVLHDQNNRRLRGKFEYRKVAIKEYSRVRTAEIRAGREAADPLDISDLDAADRRMVRDLVNRLRMVTL